MEVIAAIHGRRSVRSMIQAGQRDLIESVIGDAAQAPPPFRGQVPWAFNVLQGVERIAAYGARATDYTREHHPDEPGWDWLDDPASRSSGMRRSSSSFPVRSAIAAAPART